jgi:hypothetical protein
MKSIIHTMPEELSNKIDEARSWMFEGDFNRVASISRKSRVYVSKVMNKRAFNTSILEAAIKVMNENKRRFEIEPSMKIA